MTHERVALELLEAARRIHDNWQWGGGPDQHRRICKWCHGKSERSDRWDAPIEHSPLCLSAVIARAEKEMVQMRRGAA
jgi:hypothetical protein